ncbi:MAG TPA: ferritin-like domain-containing protein [Aliidongia sp.]|nr:ferritin-like domain-containing protein [Aliidongia sp.]
MTTELRYALPVDQTNWVVNGQTETVLRWEYEDGRESLLTLYDKGKKNQWDAAERIDWSLDLDPENPMLLPEHTIAIFGTPMWDRLTAKEKANFRRHAQAWNISQFLHGEQGALICTAKIVQQVPNMDSKFYAATQVIDEARHVEAYSRLLHEKFELAYPITPPLKSLLNNVIEDSRWDFTYLGMQVLIEGLALAAFHGIRNDSRNPLAASVNAYVMQDEARHVAFGRLALRDYYPQLTQHERDIREEFVVEGCYHMRDRFLSEELWAATGLPVEECIKHVETSPGMRDFRRMLFSRIVPIVKDIGLWGPKVQKAFTDMGVMEFSQLDSTMMMAQDEQIAREFDAGHGTYLVPLPEMPVAGTAD